MDRKQAERFSEPDESSSRILAEFEAGQHGLTERPAHWRGGQAAISVKESTAVALSDVHWRVTHGERVPARGSAPSGSS